METLPTISIIIACYNAEKYIIETLESVIKQTYSNFEIIAIDDGSTDNTLSILKKYQKNDTHINIISQSNQHCTKARINGITHSKGKYIIFLDSDDIIAPTYLEKCNDVLERNPDISIVYAKARLFGRINKSWFLPKFNIKRFLLGNCIYVSSLIRKSDYDKVGGFDERLSVLEDWDLFISIIKNGGKVYKIEEELFFYRKRNDETSVTDTASKEITSDNQFIIYKKHYEFYKENGIFLQDIFSTNNKYYDKKINI